MIFFPMRLGQSRTGEAGFEPGDTERAEGVDLPSAGGCLSRCAIAGSTFNDLISSNISVARCWMYLESEVLNPCIYFNILSLAAMLQESIYFNSFMVTCVS